MAAPAGAAPRSSRAGADDADACPANTLGGGVEPWRPPSRSASRIDSGLSPRLHPLRSTAEAAEDTDRRGA